MVSKEIDASALWKKIIHNAWKSAENRVYCSGIRLSANPCPTVLPTWDSVQYRPTLVEKFHCVRTTHALCRYQLVLLVVIPFTPEVYFDFELLEKHVALAQRIMDDIIDLELEKIRMHC